MKIKKNEHMISKIPADIEIENNSRNHQNDPLKSHKSINEDFQKSLKYMEKTGIKNFKLVTGSHLLKHKARKNISPELSKGLFESPSMSNMMSIADEAGSDPGIITKR
jgi:hypothetical protein